MLDHLSVRNSAVYSTAKKHRIGKMTSSVSIENVSYYSLPTEVSLHSSQVEKVSSYHERKYTGADFSFLIH